MTTSAPFRFLRTGLIGSIILGFAAGGHVAGGGELPAPAILTALCALIILPVAILTRTRLSLPVFAGQRARARMPGRLGGSSRWLRSMMGQAAPRRPRSPVLRCRSFATG